MVHRLLLTKEQKVTRAKSNSTPLLPIKGLIYSTMDYRIASIMAKKVHLNTKHNDKADLTIHSRQNIHKHTQERSYPALLLVLLKDL